MTDGLIVGEKAVKVSYTYDSWGKVLSVTGDTALGNVNPFRYRGYYYDVETGFYYLYGRYYDPEVGRFLNADDTGLLITSLSAMTDKNLFAYCDNNPITRKDENGRFWNIAAGAIIGAVISGGLELAIQIASPEKVDWVSVGIAALGGAAGEL